MSDASTPPPPQNPPPYTPPPAAFPAMPKNAAGAMSSASGFLGGGSPYTIVTLALALMLTAVVISFIHSFFSVNIVNQILNLCENVAQTVGTVLLWVGAARIVADAFRGK